MARVSLVQHKLNPQGSAVLNIIRVTKGDSCFAKWCMDNDILYHLEADSMNAHWWTDPVFQH